MFDIDKIIQAADLRALVERAGGELDNHGRSVCPLHGGKNADGFSVYNKDGRDYWKCFSGSCGGGDVISFVQLWQGLDFKKACAFLGGDIVSDPVAMEESARKRLEAAKQREVEAQLKTEARRKELQSEELHLLYHNQMSAGMIAEWERRGLNASWRGFFCVGGCPDKKISFRGAEYHTPTLTIPIFDERRNVLNIKHRLLNPPKPTDKYRPEREGLGAFPPMLAIPEQGYDGAVIWVLEGEIKALVSCAVADTTDWQFIGVPGRSQYNSLIEKVKGKNVIVIPDPGAETDASAFCKVVNGRWLTLPDKIDDFVMANKMDGDVFRAWEKQARRIR